MKEKIVSIFSSIGALFAGCFGSCGVACLATGCCGSYALLGFIGLSGSTIKFLGALTPIFFIITVISLAYGFYKAYAVKKALCRVPTEKCETSSAACCQEEKPKTFFQSKTFLWVVTILCFVMWIYPYVIKNNANAANGSPCCPVTTDSTQTPCCPEAQDTLTVLDFGQIEITTIENNTNQ
jgi:hypothetical protein